MTFRYMTRRYFFTEKQEFERDEAVRTEFGRQLRAHYEAVMQEPLPARLARLIAQFADGAK